MAHFSRLRLQGFKSFVDRTDLDIGPGLTGVVGPNGCGKSNLVEALSWVMGETSAKRLRGSGMDDVIFNGTSTRPARNAAEVSLVLDNTDRTAPAIFNTTDEIEVVRRIERDMGSSYSVNGKTVRARDVQMLFADMGIGAHSTAIVSQGRIAAVINAKPAERRQILEESAGVSGLYVRRHEAELRLRAADNNLARLQDIVANLDTQLDSLKRQSRQAKRYKDISDGIRNLEVLLALAEWVHAQETRAAAESAQRAAELQVAEHMATVAQLTNTHLTQSAELPPLRDKQAETAASWQAQNFELRRLDDEEARLTKEIDDATQMLQQAKADLVHENTSAEENSKTLSQLDTESQELNANAQSDDELQRLTSEKNQAQEKASETQASYQSALEQAANIKASRSTLQSQLSQDENRLQTIRTRLDDLKSKIAQRRSEQSLALPIQELQDGIANLEATQSQTRSQEQDARNARDAAQQNVETARSVHQASRESLTKLQTEIHTLESFLKAESQDGFKPILDDIKADEGFETALSKALGDTLAASTDSNAAMYWAQSAVMNAPSLPSPARPLVPHVSAPDVLKTALSFIGYVDSDSDGDAAARNLQPGQSIVSRSGAYWRWDGLRLKAESVDRNAIRLKNRNRYDDLQNQLPQLQAEFSAAETALNNAQNALNDARNSVQNLETSLRDIDRELNAKRSELQRTLEKRSASESELVKLEENLTLLQDDQVRLEDAVRVHQNSLLSFDDAALSRHNDDVEQKRSTLQTAQEEFQFASTALEVFQQNQSRRNARLRAIADERVNLQNRVIRARERSKQLEERIALTETRLEELKIRPKEINSARANLLDNLATLENAKNAAADKLAQVEQELDATTKALKVAENNLMDQREQRAKAMAQFESASGSIEIIRQSIHDQFATTPEELWEQSSMTREKLDAEPIDRLRGKRDRLVRERDGMGPVNLRADVEAQEIEQQAGKLLEERNDLIAAIEELRAGIQKLNREARERLMSAFETVNQHFQVLFTRLFGGGSAHLAFIESDDPLEAALEIYAQPPGKSLQSLSLLSGGEKTLASTALIFAMFLTNPAPVCILDEIDAPLDDANVDRVCTLLEEIVQQCKTRFIIITHHRLTMARMNRLYGVTMGERGVSQLVSVDLQQKFDFLEEAA
jgi:chromosome segregation protein